MGETGERNQRKQMGERKLGKPTGQSHGSSSPTETIKKRERKRGQEGGNEGDGNVMSWCHTSKFLILGCA
jgi:hypothetical protein